MYFYCFFNWFFDSVIFLLLFYFVFLMFTYLYKVNSVLHEFTIFSCILSLAFFSACLLNESCSSPPTMATASFYMCDRSLQRRPHSLVQSQRKQKHRSYSQQSGMGLIELDAQYDFQLFEERVKQIPGVMRVEHSKPKPPGNHYVDYCLLVYTEQMPHRYIRMELTTHGHRQNSDNCSAIHWKPAHGLEQQASRILSAAVAGWELNPRT